MMGWRVGYVAFPPELSLQLLKCQDTIVICPAVLSQKAALGALQPGRAWVEERVAALAEQKVWCVCVWGGVGWGGGQTCSRGRSPVRRGCSPVQQAAAILCRRGPCIPPPRHWCSTR